MEGARFALTALQGFWESQRDSSETYSVKGMDVTRSLAQHLHHFVTTITILLRIRGKSMKSFKIYNMFDHVSSLLWTSSDKYDLPFGWLLDLTNWLLLELASFDVDIWVNP